jgi:hypothetical protein
LPHPLGELFAKAISTYQPQGNVLQLLATSLTKLHHVCRIGIQLRWSDHATATLRDSMCVDKIEWIEGFAGHCFGSRK